MNKTLGLILVSIYLNQLYAESSKLSVAVSTKSFTASPVTELRTRTNETSTNGKVKVTFSCFASNMRYKGNVLALDQKLIMKGKIKTSGSEFKDFSVEVPSNLVTKYSTMTISNGDAIQTGLPAGTSINGTKENLAITLPLTKIDRHNIDRETGKISVNTEVDANLSIYGVYFEQKMTGATRDYSGYATKEKYEALYGNSDSPTLRSVTFSQFQDYYANYIPLPGRLVITSQACKDGLKNPDGSCVTTIDVTEDPTVSISDLPEANAKQINASLPGDAAFCDGYMSPLMVFFDQKRPEFKNISQFDMGTGSSTYWPEKNHHGYFVGLLNKNNKIENVKDLFGEDGISQNGFQKLSKYDDNKDQVIDKKDKVFKKLVLWKDNSGTGVYYKKDSIQLSKKIDSINLKYENKTVSAGIGAEYRQFSTFNYKVNKQVKTGEIIDVWFKPYVPNLAQNDNK